MVYNPDKEFVSEPGTATIMSIAQEPHSVNEMAKKARETMENTKHKVEPSITSQPATDPAEAKAEEPSTTPEQREAAGTLRAATESVVGGNTRIFVYIAGALVVAALMGWL